MNNAYRLSYLLGLVAAITPVLGNVLFTASDTFDGTKGTLTVDGSGNVNSFAWFSAGATSYVYGDGRLVNSADRSALGFFTEPGEAVSLAVGQTITVSTYFTYDRSGGNTGERLRFGLYRSVANPDAINSEGFTPVPSIPAEGEREPNTQARPIGDYNNNSSIVDSHFVNLYTGFSVNRMTAKTSAGTVPEPNVVFYERVGDPAANSVLGNQNGMIGIAGFNQIATGGNAFTIPGGGWFNTTTLARTPLYLIFSITYVGVDGVSGNNIVDLDYELYGDYGSGWELLNSFAIAGHETTVPLTFDAVGLYGRSAYPNYDDIAIVISGDEIGPPMIEAPVLQIERSAAQVVIRSPSVAGLSYQLRVSNNLGGWVNDGAPVSGTGGEITFVRSAPSGGAKSFYRVAVSAE